MDLNIGIVTIVSWNYGNRLQNYALQYTLRKLGAKAYTLPMKHSSRKTEIKNLIKYILWPFMRNKNWCWVCFDKKYIAWSGFIHNDPGISDTCDYFIAGSDQIWNPYFHFNSEREFLTFVSKGKRIAYAGSVGVSQLPDKETERRFEGYWKEFSAISVREDTAAAMIKKVAGLEVPVVLDPTMLLNTAQWSELSSKSRLKPKRKFILKYFLTQLDDLCEREINDYAEIIHAEIIDIYSNPVYQGTYIGPIEFLYLIQHSEMVFANSFHAVALSVVFHKNFMLFRRTEESGTGDMNSRLECILEMFGLENRYIEEPEKFKECLRTNIDYVRVDRIIEKKREESLSYLENILGISDDKMS